MKNIKLFLLWIIVILLSLLTASLEVACGSGRYGSADETGLKHGYNTNQNSDLPDFKYEINYAFEYSTYGKYLDLKIC